MRWTEIEMPCRRSFLMGAVAANLSPVLGWADAGDPRFLAAGRMPDGTYRLFGLSADAQIIFSLLLPARGHAATSHPIRPEAVAFARRPGTFAIVLDCISGAVRSTLHSPSDRHFYGHGVYSLDGSRLFTTENAFEIGEGRVGVWAVDEGYRRIGEFDSGGIGPHEICRLPGKDILLVANGGIETHPDSGRTKLNLPTMQPNLTYLYTDGRVLDQVEMPPELRLNSIRHLSVRPDGLVGFACQWQGNVNADVPLQGIHRTGSRLKLLRLPPDQRAEYAGSIAFSIGGDCLAVTFPRSNGFALWPLVEDRSVVWHDFDDACGVGPGLNSFLVTSGTGATMAGDVVRFTRSEASVPVAWDNHLVAIH